MKGWANQFLGKFNSCNAVRVEQLVQILYHMCLEVHIACWHPIDNALHRGGDLAQDPQLLTSVEQLGALHVGHAEVKISDEVEIYHGEGGSRKLRSRENSKRSPFT